MRHGGSLSQLIRFLQISHLLTPIHQTPLAARAPKLPQLLPIIWILPKLALNLQYRFVTALLLFVLNRQIMEYFLR